jgi:hypothetical protein
MYQFSSTTLLGLGLAVPTDPAEWDLLSVWQKKPISGEENSGYKTIAVDKVQENVVLHKLRCRLALWIYVSALKANTKLYDD